MSTKAANKNGTDRTFAEASKHIQVINNHGSCDKGFKILLKAIILLSRDWHVPTFRLCSGVKAT